MRPGLAYLCGEYPRATDTFIQREVRGLRERGFRVETISVRTPSAREQGTIEQKDERERTWYLLPCSPFRLIAAHSRMLLRAPGCYFAAVGIALRVRAAGLKSLLLQCAYFLEAGMVADRMHSQGLTHLHNHAPDSSGYVAMIASKMGSTTFSMTLHGFGAFSEPTRWRLREKLERCAFAICVSRYGRGQAMLWSNPESWSKYEVVHCGIDLEPRIRARHEGKGTRILFAGRLDHVKGLPLLIQAMKELVKQDANVTLDLIGDGPEREYLERCVAENGLERVVRFHGYQSQRELRESFAAADVFVMTSFQEGIPVVLMEAMSAGLPVVAPNIAGIPELVEHEVSGLLFPCSDVDQLVGHLQSLLNDGERRERIAAAGREVVAKTFNRESELAKLDSILRVRLASDAVVDSQAKKTMQREEDRTRPEVGDRARLRVPEKSAV